MKVWYVDRKNDAGKRAGREVTGGDGSRPEAIIKPMVFYRQEGRKYQSSVVPSIDQARYGLDGPVIDSR